ncbi:MAG: hypothetical protein AABN34_22760 [Acidobacteriota bacterium]
MAPPKLMLFRFTFDVEAAEALGADRHRKALLGPSWFRLASTID